MKYKIEKNKLLEVGYMLKKNTFYYLSQGCHWLEEDDLNVLLSARPQPVAQTQRRVRS